MELTLDPKTTALVLIDLQNIVVARDTAPHAASDVVSRCAALAAAVRAAGGAVVYVHVLVQETVALPADVSRPRPANIPSAASELVPGAGFQPGDVLVAKRQWGAFYGTDLDQQLRRRGIRTLIFGGIATNIGVESTARAAHDRGYELVFAEDAMSTFTKEMHTFAVTQIFPLMGRVRSTEQLIAALRP